MNLCSYTLEERENGLSKKLLEGANGCCCGISCHVVDTFNKATAHADQEGFYVLEGDGYALIDGTELPISAHTALLLPPGAFHAFRSSKSGQKLVLFWYHSAV